jgi:hypothetical protein
LTNFIGIVVADDGSPSLSATQFFNFSIMRPVQPQAEAFVANAQFSLFVQGDSGPDYAFQISTNLSDWATIYSTNSPLLPFYWSDPEGMNSEQRFYRVLLGP